MLTFTNRKSIAQVLIQKWRCTTSVYCFCMKMKNLLETRRDQAEMSLFKIFSICSHTSFPSFRKFMNTPRKCFFQIKPFLEPIFDFFLISKVLTPK